MATQLRAQQRRFVAVDQFLQAVQEPNRQPLYSAAAVFGALPNSGVRFFGYARGSPVNGAGFAASPVSTGYHTNMAIAGQLAQPRTFLIQAIRLWSPNLTFTAADVPNFTDTGFSVAAIRSDAWEDLLFLTYSSLFNFTMGQKTMVSCPARYLPGNAGLDGSASVASADGTAATVTSQDFTTPHTAGPEWSLTTYPILIASQQQFGASLTFPWATPPTLRDPRLVFAILDGIQAREVL